MATSDPVKLVQYRTLTIDGDTTTIVMDPVMTPDDPTNSRPNYGAPGMLAAPPGIASGKLTFKAELLPGNAWGKLLPLCDGVSATASGTTTWTFTRTSTVADLILNTDGRQEALRNARGTLKVNFKDGQPPELEFTMTGRYEELTDTAAGTVTPSASVPPVFGRDNTTVTLDGTTPVVTTLELDLGNQVQARQDANSSNGVRGGVIVNKSSTFSATLESVAQGTYDYRAKRDSSAVVGLSVTCGKFVFSGNVQYLQVPHSNENGILARNLSGQFVDRNGGGLQIVINP